MAVRLRALEEGDLAQLRDWRNDDQLRPTFREYRLLNMARQWGWWEQICTATGHEMFGIEYAPTVAGNWKTYPWQLVGAGGLCHIHPVNRTAEVSLYVAPAYWDLALERLALDLLITKAFGEFNLHRLWTETYEFNQRNIDLLEEAGFRLEGRLRQHVFRSGQYHDSLLHGLLREEAL